MNAPPSRSPRPRRPLLAALVGLALPAAPTLALLVAPSCDGAGPGDAAQPAVTAAREQAPAVAEPTPTPAPEPTAAEPPAAGPTAEAPAEPAGPPPPIGLREATRTILAYSAPRYGSDMRGRIDIGSAFAIRGMVEGTGCGGDGWALVDNDSYACLKNAAVTEAAPIQRPPVPEGLLVPYIYAKPNADRKGKLLAEVPRYRNKAALLAGKEPVDYLAANHQYAFVEELTIPGHGDFLRDEDDQLVPVKDMKFEKPSEFHGRVLADKPVPAGLAAAWVISREADLRREPKIKAKIEGRLEYHAPLDVKPAVIGGGGSRWIEVPGAYGPDVPGYVEANKVRVWTNGLVETDIGDDEMWIDVDLGQQMLAVMRGQSPTFITLVSSGTGHKPNTATPKGLYRIRNKLAYGPMRNRPEDAEESPYHVEAVPWVQYFFKRFALHGAYWHNGFGHRKSHGCVNLAPRDARYVFERTGPGLPAGWMTAYEHADKPGSVVRVRKGLEPVPDRRTEHDTGPDDAPLLARAEG